MKNLIESCRSRVQSAPEAAAYTFLPDGEDATARLTLHDLDQEARRIGGMLQALGARRQPVLLVYRAGLDFIAAFWGAVYAGAIAVPAPAPLPGMRKQALVRLGGIVRDASPRVVLTESSLRAELEDVLRSIGCTDVPIACSDEQPSASSEWSDPGVEPGDLAYLQYTSGSTETPKGVMVSHGNVLANCAFIAEACAFNGESTLVNWVPTFHDQGLIYGVCVPIVVGFEAIHMSPNAFVEKPARWLRAISRYRATHAGGPNFCFELCAQRCEPDDLDLVAWRVAYNAAEPVRHDTLKRFAEKFACAGFRASAFQPCYGLAEATLRVAAAPPNREPKYLTLDVDGPSGADGGDGRGADRHRSVLVGHGPLVRADRLIRIVDPVSGEPLPPGRVGEIWVWGPDVGIGYWKRPAETADVFGAKLASEPGRAFLRTGDLGIEKDGELYVAGRLKDLVILRGTNFYPQDLEHTVERAAPKEDGAMAWVRGGCVAAFGVDAGDEEAAVVAAEVDGEPSLFPDVARKIREALGEVHGIDLHRVLLLKPRTLPKTSSGKVQRRACREAFVRGELEVAWEATRGSGIAEPAGSAAPPFTAMEQVLADIWADVLGVAPTGRDDDFFMLGGHSLQGLQVVNRIRHVFALEVPVALLFGAPTLGELARELEDRMGSS